MKKNIHSIKKIFCFSIILLFVFSLNAYADITVELTLDRSSVSLVDTVVAKVTVTGKRKSSFPDIDGLSFFDVVKGVTSSRVEIINNSKSVSVEYTFYLTPLKPGEFFIGPARVRIKKKTYTSNTVKLTVLKEKNDKTKNENKPLFLKSQISKNNLYVNQNALYTLRLFKREQVANISLEMPNVEGLGFERLAEQKKYSTIINAKLYEVVELKYVLIPKKKGDYKIPGATMRMTCYEKNRRKRVFQDSFFNMSRGKPVYLSSNEIQLNVKTLPDLNRPDNFSGLTGKFEIKTTLAPTKVKANESATLTITVKGTGNVRQIPDLKIPDVKGLKLYQDKSQLNINKGESAILGEKIMKWAIVPGKGGDYKIPVIGLSFFDPEQESYRKLETEPFILTALDICEEEGAKINPLIAEDDARREIKKKDKQEIARIGKDIFPVHTSADPIKGIKQQKLFNYIFIFFILAPPFICLLLFTSRKFFKHNNKNRLFIQAKNAKKEFMKKVQARDIPLEKIHGAAIDYMNTRFLLKGGLLTSDEIHDLLINKGVSENTASMFRKTFASMESIIFMGEKTDNTDLIRDKLIRVIKAVNQETE